MSTVISALQYIIQGTDMGYTSIVFVGCLAVFLCVFYLLRRQKAKQIFLLAANLIFYVWAGSRGALIIVCATGLIVYLASRRMETIYRGYEAETKDLSSKERRTILTSYKKRTKKYLWLAIALILAVWVYVKAGRYLEFDSVGRLQSFRIFRTVIIPLGISYYSLSSIGYLLDVYWRKVKPEHNFLTLFAVMTYFPHIVQGPISKYSKLTAQMRAIPKFEYQRVCYGLQLMLWGFVKKMVIADRLALFTETIFANPAQYAGLEILLAVVLSVFQLYADFSGCMDIVRGISQAIGMDLDENFKQPLFSRSAAEFWRRWHITLGAWMREYIYLPISTNPRFLKWIGGMKKGGKARLSSFLKTLVPTLAVWLLTGLWHGTGADYIAWGLYWCVLIVLSAELKKTAEKINTRLRIRTDSKPFHVWQALRTDILFGIGRMFTVAGGLAGCGVLWRRLFHGARLWVLFDGSLFTHGMDQKDFLAAALGIVLLLLVDFWHEKGVSIRKTLAEWPLPIRWAVYYGAILAVLIFGIYGSGYDAASFLYGAF